jgi:hypothetical protein
MFIVFSALMQYHELMESPKMPSLFRRQQSMNLADVRGSVVTGSFDEESAQKFEQKQALEEEDARAYRQNILQQQKKTGIKTKMFSSQSSASDSPGLKKEKFTDKLKKQQKDTSAHGHGGPGQDASATFSQCVFNLANILMVGNTSGAYQNCVFSLLCSSPRHLI